MMHPVETAPLSPPVKTGGLVMDGRDHWIVMSIGPVRRQETVDGEQQLPYRGSPQATVF
jgi:hypothetical protein